jgi:hypothetical protein
METWGNKVKKALARLDKTDNYLYTKPEQDWTHEDRALVISFLRKSKVAENTQMEDLKKVQEFFSKPIGKETKEDPTDIIAMDVPLFLRMLEYAREDAEQDVDLHNVAERAIEAVKLRGLLSMEDYNDLIGGAQQVDEVRLIPKRQIETLAAKLAAQIFSKTRDNKPAIDILKKALEDAYRALDPDVKIEEEEGYSKYLKDDPEFPGGKTPGLTPDVLNKILMKIANVDDIDETTRLGEGVIYEELCPKGKAYIKKRQAAGEKSSAYLSGRAVKVCKGQMKG